jgi:hypothetical protein
MRRLGIRITCKNPEAWNIGNDKVSFGVNIKSAGGIVKGISAQALSLETRFHLMLVTVIQGDRQLKSAVAPKRAASPSPYDIWRVIDGSSRYKYQEITANSWFNQAALIAYRDDTQAATDDALSRRSAHEMPNMTGPVKVPKLTNAYSIGDRVTDLIGRNINLRTNVGDAGGEGPMYPRIVGYECNLDGEQSTTFHLSDDRGGIQVTGSEGLNG